MPYNADLINNGLRALGKTKEGLPLLVELAKKPTLEAQKAFLTEHADKFSGEPFAFVKGDEFAEADALQLCTSVNRLLLLTDARQQLARIPVTSKEFEAAYNRITDADNLTAAVKVLDALPGTRVYNSDFIKTIDNGGELLHELKQYAIDLYHERLYAHLARAIDQLSLDDLNYLYHRQDEDHGYELQLRERLGKHDEDAPEAIQSLQRYFAAHEAVLARLDPNTLQERITRRKKHEILVTFEQEMDAFFEADIEDLSLAGVVERVRQYKDAARKIVSAIEEPLLTIAKTLRVELLEIRKRSAQKFMLDQLKQKILPTIKALDAEEFRKFITDYQSGGDDKAKIKAVDKFLAPLLDTSNEDLKVIASQALSAYPDAVVEALKHLYFQLHHDALSETDIEALGLHQAANFGEFRAAFNAENDYLKSHYQVPEVEAAKPMVALNGDADRSITLTGGQALATQDFKLVPHDAVKEKHIEVTVHYERALTEDGATVDTRTFTTTADDLSKKEAGYDDLVNMVALDANWPTRSEADGQHRELYLSRGWTKDEIKKLHEAFARYNQQHHENPIHFDIITYADVQKDMQITAASQSRAEARETALHDAKSSQAAAVKRMKARGRQPLHHQPGAPLHKGGVVARKGSVSYRENSGSDTDEYDSDSDSDSDSDFDPGAGVRRMRRDGTSRVPPGNGRRGPVLSSEPPQPESRRRRRGLRRGSGSSSGSEI